MSDFSTKFVTSLSLINKGGKTRAFFPLTKVLITDLQVLNELLELLILSPRRLNYLFF